MNGFPAEVWDAVLSYLDPLEDRQIVVSLCLVSKLLLHIARPMLYSVLAREDLHQESLAATLSGMNGEALSGMVREVVMDNYLGMEDLVVIRKVENNEREFYTEAEVQSAQMKMDRRRDQAMAVVKDCRNVCKMDFFVDEPRVEFLMFRLTSLPALARMLSFPFLDNLRELCIWDQYGSGIDYSPIGQLVLACRQLRKVKLRYLWPKSFFQPILFALSQQPDLPIALDTLECIETRSDVDSTEEPPLWFNEMLRSFALLPCLRHIIFTGSWAHYDFLEDEIRGLRMLQVTRLTINEISPQYYAHHSSPDAMQLLSRYFPHLQELSMAAVEAVSYRVADITMPLLRVLSLTEKRCQEEDPRLSPVSIFICLPDQLLHRDFAPKLEMAKFRMRRPEYDAAAIAGVEEAEEVMGEVDMLTVGERLVSVEVIYGAERRVFCRGEQGFFVAGM